MSRNIAGLLLLVMLDINIILLIMFLHFLDIIAITNNTLKRKSSCLLLLVMLDIYMLDIIPIKKPVRHISCHLHSLPILLLVILGHIRHHSHRKTSQEHFMSPSQPTHYILHLLL